MLHLRRHYSPSCSVRESMTDGITCANETAPAEPRRRHCRYYSPSFVKLPWRERSNYYRSHIIPSSPFPTGPCSA